jgi:hypothetical protein
MSARWRLPLALSALVLLGQLLHRSPLIDAVTETSPENATLSFPLGHILLAPLTLVGDWLNGGSINDLRGFIIWVTLGYVLARLSLDSASTPGRLVVRREIAGGVAVVAALILFIAWLALVPRPIPRLLAGGDDALVLDVHTHTEASHDGRRGFGRRRNAEWHRRAGFDVAFVTDHGIGPEGTGAQGHRGTEVARGETRLLGGVELSLSALHLLVLGVGGRIDAEGYADSWESTGALIRKLSGHGDAEVARRNRERGDTARAERAPRPFLVASLPEYWRHHWGEDLGTLVSWGVEGFEIWTTSPKAMTLPRSARRAVVARCRLSGLTMFGSTDMHGYGYTASVWNLVRLPGWREMGDSALTGALLARFRSSAADATRVLALRRWQPEGRLGRTLAVPGNLALLLGTASRAHGAALLGWIWLWPLAGALRSRRRRTN